MGRGLIFLPAFLINNLLSSLEPVNELVVMIVQIISSHVLSLSLLYTVWVLYELEIPLYGLKCEKKLCFVASF